MKTFKSIAKRFVAPEHWLFMSWYRDKFGLFPAMVKYFSIRKGELVALGNSLARETIYLRPGTTDQDVYDEIFVEREYELELGDPQVIVDAGAHIGLSAIYFANRYPNATIIAIEPEPLNFEVLCKNAKRYQNIKTLRAGLWSKKCFLRIQDSEVDTWSFRVFECPESTGIPAVGICDVMADFSLTSIDVLKIDIEGSEIEVLNDSSSWIDSVRAIVIELHDRFRPGCAAALENAIKGHHFDRATSGESLVITNLRRPAHK